MELSLARFGVGDLIHHRVFDYRGVVYDVDPVFLGTEEWYEEAAKSRPPKDEPWYHVLPDGETHTTYVAERNLEADVSGGEILQPLVEEYFERLNEGHYVPRFPAN